MGFEDSIGRNDEMRRLRPILGSGGRDGRALDFSIEWVGLDEETNPNLVNTGVRTAQNQSTQNVSDLGASGSFT